MLAKKSGKAQSARCATEKHEARKRAVVTLGLWRIIISLREERLRSAAMRKWTAHFRMHWKPLREAPLTSSTAARLQLG
jgi:hypothetical protein